MATKKKTDDVSTELVKKEQEEVKVIKKKPRGGNSPVIGMNGYNLEPGDNSKMTRLSIQLFNLPNIDLDDVKQVEDRLTEYFAIYDNADMKPTVSGMALALNGHNRQWLWAVTHDQPLNGRGSTANLRPEVSDIIKKAYFMMEILWEQYMQNGKVNPVAGIFLAKNNFGYQDKTEYVLTPNANNDSDINPDSIKQRYLIDSNDSDESDS
jgi:hypothetical protein